LADAFNVSIRTEQYSTIYSVANKMIFSLENILILYFASLMIMRQEGFSLGMMYAFLQYKGQFSGSVSSLVDNFYQLKMIDLHLDRIADIALEKPDRAFEDEDIKKSRPEIQGAIQVDKISFRYDMFEPLLFDEISFAINAGESVAFIGPSGCGKSTLMKILIGLLEAEKGVVKIDGHPLKDIALSSYRNQIACVMQNDSLLAGSIRQNIAFFDEHIDDSRIIECSKMAQIHDDIMAMTSQYETMVGELGSQLSGGQQQRLLIARALYKRPKILLLDEATSHLDIKTEALVSAAISKLKITRILIAHRPETIKTADRLLLLQNGRLTAMSKEMFFNE
jgi:ATP-binding cassette subfamily B protein RaxB